MAERSFNNGNLLNQYGNLLDDNITLADIWENGFKDVRFKGCRKCCRDCIKYPTPPAVSPLPGNNGLRNIFVDSQKMVYGAFVRPIPADDVFPHGTPTIAAYNVFLPTPGVNTNKTWILTNDNHTGDATNKG